MAGKARVPRKPAASAGADRLTILLEKMTWNIVHATHEAKEAAELLATMPDATQAHRDKWTRTIETALQWHGWAAGWLARLAEMPRTAADADAEAWLRRQLGSLTPNDHDGAGDA